MLLAIDAGNTNTVFAVFDGSDCKGIWRSATEARRTADEYAIWLEQVMKRDGLNPKDIDQAIIASVVPSANFNLSRLCTDRFSRPPLVIGKTTISAMQAGIFWGYVGLIEGLVGRMRAEMIGASIGAPRAVVATGGLATLFSQAH